MNERAFARGIVALTVAVVVGALFWFWGELNWKNVGGPSGIVAVGLAGAGLGALFGYRMAGRATPIDWIHELVRTAMVATFVSGVGVLVAYLGDFNPSGGGLISLTNNLPNVSSPAFTALMIGATAVATSSVLPIWRHRHAVRTAGDRPLGETLAACGAWLGGVAWVLGLLGVVIGIDLARALVFHAALSLALGAAFLLTSFRRAPGRPGRVPLVLASVGGSLAALTLVAGCTGSPLPGQDVHRSASACLAAGQGLFRDARVARVTGYRAPGVDLRRIECQTTRLYNDEHLVVVLGRQAGGRDLRGAELFVRIAGTPLERARAACEILLPGRCEAPLSSPSELVGFTAEVPPNENVAPHESAGRLRFYAETRDYPNGRATTIGSRRVLVPHAVDLATGEVVDGR